MTDSQLRAHLEVLDELEERLHSDFYDGDRQRLLTFSDNVAIAWPFTSDDPDAVIESVVRVADGCADYQLERVLHGRAVRGGIAMGDVFCDGHLIDGPALVDAVLPEEERADVPRIVLHDSVASALAGFPQAGRLWPRHLFVRDVSDDTPIQLLVTGEAGHAVIAPRSTPGSGARAVERQLAPEGSAEVGMGGALPQLVRRPVHGEQQRSTHRTVSGRTVLRPVATQRKRPWLDIDGFDASDVGARRTSWKCAVDAERRSSRGTRSLRN